MKLKLLAISLFLCISVSAQTKIIDSITTLLKTPLSDSIRVKAYGDLCWYYGAISLDSAFYYGNLALDLSKTTKNLKGEAQAYNDLGILLYKTSDFNGALSYYKKALVIRTESRDSLGMGSIFNKMGIAYQRIFKMDSAIFFNTKALEIYEKYNNVRYVALIKNNNANIYFNLKQYNKALNEHLEVAEIRSRIQDNFGLVHSYTNIGNSYLYLKDTTESVNYYIKGIEIAEENNYEQELSTLYNNYGAILKDRNDFDAALVMFYKSLVLREKLNDSYGIASVELNLGDLLLSTGKINEAEEKLRKGLLLAKKINAHELEMNSYKSMLSFFAFKKNTDSVLQYQKLYSEAQDVIFNSRVTKEIAEIEEKYETEKRDKEIAQQKEQLLKNELEIQNKNLYSILLGAGILILLIISFGLYKRQQHKKREFQNKLALKEAQTYSQLQDQRLRISRDLHDNIGSQLTFIISSIGNLKFQTSEENIGLKDKLTEINNFASSTIAQLRDTIWAMNKNELSFEDLKGRILSLFEKAKSATNAIKFKFESSVSSDIIFSSVVGINLFRAIQEAINNAIKYAKASEITLNIIETNTTIQFEIFDNGKGFNIETVTLGNGLENMDKRVQEISGTLKIQSILKKGTKIIISCPKNKSNAV